MTLRASVVVPVYNGQGTLADCLTALRTQSLEPAAYEVIVVDDGSNDGTTAIAAQCGARVLEQAHQGAPAARNAGLRAARSGWVAFTDADCVPSRSWLASLLAAVEPHATPPALGAAGPMIGLASRSAPARFVDLSGGLDTERHLAHARFPFAPSGNVMYRRDALLAVGGFDARYCAYDACDLHTRLRQTQPGAFIFTARAVVLHRHRVTWGDYWRQQVGYGAGYGQFMIRHRDAVRWSVWRELSAWAEVASLGVAACRPGNGDVALVRRGRFVKALAQRVGFLNTYWNPVERGRW